MKHFFSPFSKLFLPITKINVFPKIIYYFSKVMQYAITINKRNRYIFNQTFLTRKPIPENLFIKIAVY